MINKKSQMEILGLAIVVVLILVATIFVVRFVAFKKPTDYRKGFVSSELAYNTVNTFLKTTASECSQLSMTELLRDCAQARSITCNNIERYNSCKYFNETAKIILRDTLINWSMNYEFLVYIDPNQPLIKLGAVCRGEKKSSTPWPTPIGSGNVYTKLDICG
ncbi:hypothetical protein HYW99_01270 [Candidatus Woesearchaeota archaeon]|nr:hypothetical protein [Candidatus Woesearchaeota archaeon]